jgi:predicted amidohydrolase
MNICLIQTDPRARQGNVQFLGQAIQNINADLFVLPELFTSGFDSLALNWPNTGEVIPNGPIFLQISGFLQSKSSTVVCGLLEQSGIDFYNIAAVIRHGSIQRYRQKYPATTTKGQVLRILPGDYQKIAVPSGASPWTMGLMICNDHYRADEFFDEYKKRKVNAVILIADSATRAWLQEFPTLCQQYGLTAIICNAAGPGGGGSCILNPAGECVPLRTLQSQVEYKYLPETAVAAIGLI